ncbi:VapC toxin family PIN domain ribonuclease [Candidatus Desulfarcum epimagneticum]|uniref:VapC toxin family PIN domain ribonuclease n=1 Tax=uncultured Desulfobacteraceae bacterium TaxID=218296 RepID=A0A484HJZ4_9BACT|nr:VapC toxin family PIN domain ribonuclease [uncultured Desulfobacteraceae bacterium]
MNVIDSSGWLSYFADEPSAENFHAPIQDIQSLIVPVITIYEVFKVVFRESGENQALQAVAAMRKGKVIELTARLAITASKLSLRLKLPMADSIILATAKDYDAVVWTRDIDFKGIAGVKYFPK